MNPTQLPFLVEGILVIVCMIFGLLLSKAGKPYGKIKLVIHLFFFLWFSVGFGFISYGVFVTNIIQALWIPVAIMGLMLFVQLATGAFLLFSKNAKRSLARIHLIAASVMLVVDVISFIISGFVA